MATSGTREKALKLIRSLPRVALDNIKSIQPKLRKEKRRSFAKGKTHGRGHKGQGQHMTLPRLGFEGGNKPFYLRIPKEPYYENHHLRRQYPPLSLLQLQRFIELGRVDVSRPVDLTQLCNTGLYQVKVDQKHFGVNLTEEGADIFSARVNLEVQWTSEVAIAAVERNGGTLTLRYYDPRSLRALTYPRQFFQRSCAIPRCRLPPQDALPLYSSAAMRGYLAPWEDVQEERRKLAQKYGYVLPDLGSEEGEGEGVRSLMRMRKDPGQVFYGLQPGWVVNLKDRVVLKPTSPEHLEMYSV